MSLAAGGALVALLLLASLYYPVGSALNRANVSDAPATLDGLAFLEWQSPAEYRAIRWLRDEAQWGRVVEAVGPDYSEYSRASSHTGYPTLLGWPTHEEHWRGGLGFQRDRRSAVDRIYTSVDLAEVESLLEEDGVRYVFVSPRERDTYPDADFDKFGNIMTTHRFQGGPAGHGVRAMRGELSEWRLLSATFAHSIEATRSQSIEAIRSTRSGWTEARSRRPMARIAGSPAP